MEETKLTDAQFKAIWAGADSAAIGAMSTEEQTPQEPPKQSTQVVNSDDNPVLASDNPGAKGIEDDKLALSDTELSKQLDRLLSGQDLEEEEDEEEQQPSVPTDAPKTPNTPDEPKKGRKPADIVNVVKSLIEDGTLLGLEGGEEVKTVEEAKEIIKLNISQKDEDAGRSYYDSKVSSFSPQGKAIVKFLEDGATSATEILDLLGTIKEIEDVNELDISNKEGQKEIIKRAYIAKGFKEAIAERQANRYSDLGPEALEEHAKELFPELKEEAATAAASRLRDREKLRVQQEEATRNYYNTLKSTLDKGTLGSIKLKKEDQAMLMEAAGDYTKHVSFSGAPTSAFIKRLEELQFGDKANYERYLSIVFHAMNPEVFEERLAQERVNKSTTETARQIRLAKTTTPNTQEERIQTSSGRKTLTKPGFANPYK